ncbi:MAG: NlpC/P60 family protein [Pseudomonadota bacterium]
MSTVVGIARSWIGTPYVHQASVKGSGTDCLGLIRGVWREALGEEPAVVPPYTADWFEPQREERLWNAARSHLLAVLADRPYRPGEVLLFRMRDGSIAKHLGILSKTGTASTFIHAYSGQGVLESSFSRPWQKRVVARFDYPIV